MVESVFINSNKVKFDTSAFYNMSKLISNHQARTMQRQTKIAGLAKYRYLRKFIFGASSKVELLD